MRTWLLCLIALTVGLSTTPALAAEGTWWEKAWPYRKEFVLDASPKGAGISTPPGRTAVLVRLHSANFQFADAKPDGSDLRFTTEDNKPLPFHVESFDPKLGVAAVWVDVADFPANATKKLWLYYGNKDAPKAGDAAATFDADYTLVYHFDGAPAAAVKDKTAYANNALAAPAGVTAAGVIGPAGRFQGAPLMVGPSPSLAVEAGGSLTFSAWVKPAAAAANGVLFVQTQGPGGIVVGLEQGLPYVAINGVRATAAQALAGNQWTLVSVSVDGEAGTVTLYVNGVSVGTASGRLPAMSGPLAFGGDLPGGSLPGFVGEMDEIRISKVARTAAKVQADIAAQGPASKLVAAGADEKQSSGDHGYFAIIFSNLTLDAWVVIAILGVLFAISSLVIVTKILYANAVDKGNSAFLRKYREASGDPLKIGDTDSRLLRSSSIVRIFNEGVAEIRRRSEDGVVVLHAEGVNVIRALMDSTMIREGQKLSANLVWLTIAISGGPFLGLLGTVVGVMITFAAIAAAGDVNINAIAPGISAALMATVAGLGVAIPALFGYNYIVIRNRNISANMNVFVEEFITRISERYSERGSARAGH
jgi:biopolymer transport protein ExbB